SFVVSTLVSFLFSGGFSNGSCFPLCFFWSLFCNHQEIGKRKTLKVVLVFAFLQLAKSRCSECLRENKITFIDLFLCGRGFVQSFIPRRMMDDYGNLPDGVGASYLG